MEEVANIVHNLLPSIDENIKDQVLKKLDELGCDCPDNLVYVDYKELCPPLKSCYARKLVTFNN